MGKSLISANLSAEHLCRRLPDGTRCELCAPSRPRWWSRAGRCGRKLGCHIWLGKRGSARSSGGYALSGWSRAHWWWYQRAPCPGVDGRAIL